MKWRFSSVSFLQVHIHLRIWDINILLIECQLDIFLEKILHIPVIISIAPCLQIKYHCIAAMIGHTDKRLRRLVYHHIRITHILENCLGFGNIVTVPDAEGTVHTTEILLAVVDKDRSVYQTIRNSNGFIIICLKGRQEKIYVLHLS